MLTVNFCESANGKIITLEQIPKYILESLYKIETRISKESPLELDLDISGNSFIEESIELLSIFFSHFQIKSLKMTNIISALHRDNAYKSLKLFSDNIFVPFCSEKCKSLHTIIQTYLAFLKKAPSNSPDHSFSKDQPSDFSVELSNDCQTQLSKPRPCKTKSSNTKEPLVSTEELLEFFSTYDFDSLCAHRSSSSPPCAPAFLSIADNALGEEGLVALESLLTYSLPSLTVLDINNTGFSKEACEFLSSLIQSTSAPNLKELYCDNNCLSNDGCASFAKILSNTPGLEYLQLSSCRLSSAGLDLVVSVLKENENLRGVNLNDSLLNPGLLVEVLSMIKKNNLKHLEKGGEAPREIKAKLSLGMSGVGKEELEILYNVLGKGEDSTGETFALKELDLSYSDFAFRLEKSNVLDCDEKTGRDSFEAKNTDSQRKDPGKDCFEQGNSENEEVLLKRLSLGSESGLEKRESVSEKKEPGKELEKSLEEGLRNMSVKAEFGEDLDTSGAEERKCRKYIFMKGDRRISIHLSVSESPQKGTHSAAGNVAEELQGSISTSLDLPIAVEECDSQKKVNKVLNVNEALSLFLDILDRVYVENLVLDGNEIDFKGVLVLLNCFKGRKISLKGLEDFEMNEKNADALLSAFQIMLERSGEMVEVEFENSDFFGIEEFPDYWKILLSNRGVNDQKTIELIVEGTTYLFRINNTLNE